MTKEKKPANGVEAQAKQVKAQRRTQTSRSGPVRKRRERTQFGFKPTTQESGGIGRNRKQKREGILARIEEDYYSNSSRAAKASRRTLHHEDFGRSEGILPALTPESIKMLAGALREAGYKSAYNVHHRSKDAPRGAGPRLGHTCWTGISSSPSVQRSVVWGRERKHLKYKKILGLADPYYLKEVQRRVEVCYWPCTSLRPGVPNGC